MKKKATAIRKKLLENKSNEKTENKIKLILNQLSPDNFDKKMGQLREILFPVFKTKDECFTAEEEYNEEIHLLTDENLNDEILEFVVKNIFKKAQDEKLFIILNG